MAPPSRRYPHDPSSTSPSRPTSYPVMSPTKQDPTARTNTMYSAVPGESPDPNAYGSSPDPSENPYSHLSGPSVPGAHLSPEPMDSQGFLGRSDSAYLPAPSILSRDSSRMSLPAPGTPGQRNSWGSGVSLAAAAGGIAGAEGRRPSVPRGQSGLNHSTLGWNDDSERTSNEDQGYITPAAAAAPGGPIYSEKGYGYKKKSRKWLWITLAVLALLIGAGVGVGLGLGLTRNKSSHSGSDSGSSGDGSNNGPSASQNPSGSATSSAAPSATPTSGGQGSLITFEDGSTITYDNEFGGTWVWDPANPFNNDAQCNSWTPALKDKFVWGQNKIFGVNIGGWLNTEPFIVPALYETYATGVNNPAIDEFTLSQNMGSNLTAAMTEHYETFITERDFAEIASAGLNFVRIPVAHWAIETIDGEPFLERVSWNYFLKAIQWCRKYGLRINLDLHTVPGSQNGWNHSGRQGSINWMYGVMGRANAERALDYIRTLAQFAVQPQYSPVIQIFGFINEPNASPIGQAQVGSFYYEAYNVIRDITGIGEGNGPFLSIHDGFLGTSQWTSFLPGADRLSLDQHPYLIFGDQPTGTLASIAQQPCQNWASSTNSTLNQFGMINAGEWSAAPNDCGKWINSVASGARCDGTYAGYTGPTPCTSSTGKPCSYWNDYTQWDQSTIDSLLQLTSASMDALQNWFFWTWKIGNSTLSPTQVNPFWHYRLGLEHGWIPKDPRSAIGTCAADGVSGDAFDGTFASPYMTGGAGANTIPAAMSASYPWPPKSFANIDAAEFSSLPQYTQTATPISMPALTYTSPGSQATIDSGNGWANANADSRKAYTPIAGCAYPPEYSAADLSPTAGECGAGLVQPTKRAPVFPGPTPAP